MPLGMTIFALNAATLNTASADLADAAADTADADSQGAYAAIATGMPGSTTARIMPDVSTAMAGTIDTWRTGIERFAENLSRTADDGVAIDEAAGGIFEMLDYVLTGE